MNKGMGLMTKLDNNRMNIGINEKRQSKLKEWLN